MTEQSNQDAVAEIWKPSKETDARLDQRFIETEAVVVEVKRVLTVEAVNDFLVDLDSFIAFFPLYRGYQIYGAVASLDVSAVVARYAVRRGLFVLAVTGESMVTIQNDALFTPRDFSSIPATNAQA